MKDLTKRFESEFGFVFMYGGFDNSGRQWTKYRVLAKSPQDVIDAMQSWHSYGNKRDTLIVPNEHFIHSINAIFGIQDGSWENKEISSIWFNRMEGKRVRLVDGYEVQTSLKTTGCGAWSVTWCKALAPTIKEHDAVYREQCESVRKERMRKSEEERERRMAKMYQKRRGWYSVMMTFRCLVWNERRGPIWIERNFSGECIASSQMAAYSKACEDVRINTEPNNGLDFDFPDPTNQSMFYAYFLGMKTDEGYSLKAWEEFSKTEEYKQSIQPTLL